MRCVRKKLNVFDIVTTPAIFVVFIVFAGMLIVFISKSFPAIERYGVFLFIRNIWKAAEEPFEETYGLASVMWGSIYTALIATLIAFFLSISYAIFVVDYAPRGFKNALIIMSDIMAGMPTIIYGIWGAFILVPFLRIHLMEPLYEYLSFIPIFNYPPVGGFSYFSAGILLAIMITPFSTAIIREAYAMIPFTYREAVLSLGATRFEATSILLGYIKPAIISGLILAFGRAVGETVAVSLVVGNTFSLTYKLFAPGYTISSLIANQFGNAFIYEYMTPTLFAAGLVLFVIGFIVNLVGLIILRRWEENVRV